MKQTIVILLVVLMTGCSLKEQDKAKKVEDMMPAIYSYELNKVEAEQADEVDKWLNDARQTGQEGQLFVHSFSKDTDKYMYTYVFGKGYSDYEVSFVYNPSAAVSKGNIFVSGLNEEAGSDSFVQIKSIYDKNILFTLSDVPLEEKIGDLWE